jgi:hypothetical protein
VYVASVAAILAEYPPATIHYVTDPRTGIASNPIDPNWTGLPDTAHVLAACERHYGTTRRMSEWEAGARQQIEQRETLALTDNRPRPTYEQLVERCRAAGLHIGPKGTERTDPDAIREKYAMTPEQWATIPNARRA